MRIALDQHQEVGLRCGRILTGAPSIEVVGLMNAGKAPADSRLEIARDLADYDILVSDETADPSRPIDFALEADLDCVLWSDAEGAEEHYGPRFAEMGRTLIIGANLASGIAPSLASHETARVGEVLEISIAWTEPGTPRRKGTPIPFPDPVGARWGRERPTEPGYQALVAPVAGEWAAAMAQVTSATNGGVVVRIVGVADQAAHLEALALAAAALTVGSFPGGVHRPAQAAEPYLAAALDSGLDVAAYSTESN